MRLFRVLLLTAGREGATAAMATVSPMAETLMVSVPSPAVDPKENVRASAMSSSRIGSVPVYVIVVDSKPSATEIVP